jgi:acyl dehydratase
MLETEEKVFSERDLLLGILWEGDAQLHTNKPGMAKTPFGSTIVHGNSVTSMAIGQLFHTHFRSVKKIRVREMNISYLAPVHVGDVIKGVFDIEERHKNSNDSEILTMTFEVIKNQQSPVSKGKITIEIN